MGTYNFRKLVYIEGGGVLDPPNGIEHVDLVDFAGSLSFLCREPYKVEASSV
jgi:hypothetical protein